MPAIKRSALSICTAAIGLAGLLALSGAHAQLLDEHAKILPAAVAQIIKRNGIPADRVGLYLGTPDGAPIVAHNMDKAFNPASAIKLVIAHAALELLGPQFTWKTALKAVGPISNGELRGDLYFAGSGDPTITYERLLGLVVGLRSRGIRNIGGSIIVDDTAYAVPEHDPSAFDRAGTKPYNGSAGAAMVGFGASRIVIRNTSTGIIAFAEPASSNFEVVNKLRSVRKRCRGNWRSRVRELLKRHEDGSATLTLKGEFPTGCGELSFYMLAQDNPSAHLAGALQGNFEMLGGSTANGWRLGKTPPSAKTLVADESRPLIEALIGMNKHSNNVMARNIFLALGGVNGSKPPYRIQDANEVVVQWLTSKGISSEGLFIENGSGLSRDSRITPRQFAKILEQAATSPLHAELTASLPIIGVDGTTRKWLRKSEVAGNFHIKTGTLRGVRTAVGYAHNGSGSDLLFVCMIDWRNSASSRKLLYDLLAWSYKQHNL